MDNQGVTFNCDQLTEECPRIVFKAKERPQKSWYEAYVHDNQVAVYREDRYGSGPVTTLIASLHFDYKPTAVIDGNVLSVGIADA